MRRERRRSLTRAELRAMGASPGLMRMKVGPDGRARLEQLVGESKPASVFVRRLTNDTKESE